MGHKIQAKTKSQKSLIIDGARVRVLGVDPGFGRMGYGVIEEVDGEFRVLDYGCFETATSEAHAPRLLGVKHELDYLITAWKPSVVGVEKLFFSKNVKTALAVGEARGVILFSIADQELPIIELSPQEVKQAVTGYGNAEKIQVQKMVQKILGLPKLPQPDDAADALALAIAAAQMRRFLAKLD